MMLGERRGGNKHRVCDNCGRGTMHVLDHGTNEWVCTECEL